VERPRAVARIPFGRDRAGATRPRAPRAGGAAAPRTAQGRWRCPGGSRCVRSHGCERPATGVPRRPGRATRRPDGTRPTVITLAGRYNVGRSAVRVKSSYIALPYRTTIDVSRRALLSERSSPRSPPRSPLRALLSEISSEISSPRSPLRDLLSEISSPRSPLRALGEQSPGTSVSCQPRGSGSPSHRIHIGDPLAGGSPCGGVCPLGWKPDCRSKPFKL